VLAECVRRELQEPRKGFKCCDLHSAFECRVSRAGLRILRPVSVAFDRFLAVVTTAA
jgi:hypothetical protein